MVSGSSLDNPILLSDDAGSASDRTMTLPNINGTSLQTTDLTIAAHLHPTSEDDIGEGTSEMMIKTTSSNRVPPPVKDTPEQQAIRVKNSFKPPLSAIISVLTIFLIITAISTYMYNLQNHPTTLLNHAAFVEASVPAPGLFTSTDPETKTQNPLRLRRITNKERKEREKLRHKRCDVC
jgi:hypothetical protein